MCSFLRRLVLILSLGSLAVACPSTSLAQATASYQAAVWDHEMTLPPNAYRAAKPVELNGDFAVKTQPGTLIEGVSFQGRNGTQHWHIAGTLMRRVRIGGQLSFSTHGIDSVFEDCEGNKDSNWFVQWWSTRWKFDNCIFTKRFVRESFPPLDYSVHATRCTFYGMKLPNVGFKEDPAKYLQKENMGFVQCRFVECEVPETFLAATVDCVFEHCRFAPKGQLKWPKETGPIKVRAYYAGLDNEIAPFINGPLSVEFSAAPRTMEFGSTLQHTQSGGRVTLASLHANEQFAQFGTVPKKASEIVDVAAGAAASGLPGAGTRMASGAIANAESIKGMEEILRALPPGIEIMKGGEPNPAGVNTANAWLAINVAGRPAATRLTLENTQVTNDGGYAYQATGLPQGILFHGNTIASQVVALFRTANAAPLGRVQRNPDFNVTGTVSKAEFVGRGRVLVFILTLGEAQVGEATATTPKNAGPAAGGYFGNPKP